MPRTPSCAKAVNERLIGGYSGFSYSKLLPLRDSAGLSPASPIERHPSKCWRANVVSVVYAITRQ